MVANRRVSEILLRYTVDKSSLDAALRDNQQFQDALNAPVKGAVAQVDVLDEFNAALAKLKRADALQGIADQFGKAVQEGRDAQEALDDVERALRRIGATKAEIAQVAALLSQVSNAKPPDTSGGGGGRSVGQNITKLGRDIFNAPAVGPSTPIARGLIGVGALVDKLGLSLTSLIAVGTPLLAVLAAVVIAFDRFSKQLQQSKQFLEGALQAQNNYYTALASSTSEQVRAQIDGLKRVRDAQQQQLAELQNSINAALEQARKNPLIGSSVTDFAPQLIVGDLQSQFDELNKQFTANEQTITRLTQGLDANAFAANDAADAERRLADERKKAADEEVAAIERRIQRNIEYNQLLRDGTSEGIQQQIDDIRIRKDVINAFLFDIKAQGTASAEAAAKAKQYATEVKELEVQQTTLTESILPLVLAREAEAKAIQDQIAAINDQIARQTSLAEQVRTASVDQVAGQLAKLREEYDALQQSIPALEAHVEATKGTGQAALDAQKALDDARTRLGQITQDYSDLATVVLPAALARAQQELADDLAEIRAKSAEKIADIEAQLGEKEAAAKETRDAAYLKAEEKRDADLAKLAEDFADKRAKIERDFGRSYQDAIRSRDAVAAEKAKQQRDDALKDLDEDGKKRTREISKQFAAERRLADDNYRKSLDQARDAARKALDQERQRAQQELDARKAAYLRQLTDLQVFANSSSAYISSFVNNSLRGLSDLALRAYQTVLGAVPGTQGVVDAIAPRLPQIIGLSAATAFAGGSTGAGALFASPRLAAPERAQMFAPAGGGQALTVNIPITGTQLTKRQIINYAYEALDNALDEAGYR